MKKNIFYIFRAISALCALTLLLVLNSCHRTSSTDISGQQVGAKDTTAAVRVDTLREVVMKIRQQSRLYTTECQVHKVVLFTDFAKLGGKLGEKLLNVKIPGDRKVAIPLDVTLKGYVDFSGFSKSNVNIADSLCIITLPDPHVALTASKVDHKATRQYVSMNRSRFSDEELQRLAAQGEDSIASHIASYGIVEQSREDCARIVVPLLTQMGFKEQNIIIRFRKSFDDAELRRLTTFEK